MNSSEKMRAIAQQVERSSQEQTRGGRQISQAIENISNMVTHLNTAHQQQTRGTEVALSTARDVEGLARRQESSVREVVECSEAVRRALS